MSSDIEQLSKALRELLEAYEARYPNAEAGQDAQTAWVMRQSKAREYAHACIAAHCAKKQQQDSCHQAQPSGGGTVPGEAQLTDAYAEGRKDEHADCIPMIAWAYGKLHHTNFTKQEDALMLDRMKLLLEHGIHA